MKNIVKILFWFVLCLSTKTLSQSLYVADKYFDEFAYTEAANAYSNIYKKGDASYRVISRLADAHYFNSKHDKAQKWYSILFSKFNNDTTIEHLFRYAQSLKGIGQYTKADEIMSLMGSLDSYDSRPSQLENSPNYVEEYTSSNAYVLSVKNLPINSKYSDFGGYISRGKLYFASSRPNNFGNRLYNWNKQPFLNLYTSNVSLSSNDHLSFIKSTLLEEPLTTKFHEDNAVITRNGKTMFFTRDNHINGITNMSEQKNVYLKLYQATLINGKWANIKELPFNSNEYSTGHPALSPDERTLYFVSNMPGGYGETDIYKVAIYPNFKFGSPINLGAKVNTEGREMFPYISFDNTLYFSSDGHLGLGGLDIFEAPIHTDGAMGKTSNMEAPFNSRADDFAFFITKENTKGVFSSNREGGKGDDDIYSFVLSQPKQKRKLISKSTFVSSKDTVANKGSKQCKQILTGLVLDKETSQVIPSANIQLIDYQGKVIATSQSDDAGIYKFELNCLSGYRVIATKDNYRKDLQVVNTTDLDRGSNLVNLNLSSLIKDNKIAIRPIYFDFDKYTIRSDSEYELENVVNVMKSNPNMVIKIESHTDSRGSSSYNRKLSQKRANATKKYIISRGIQANRIANAVGFGEDQLINKCNDKSSASCTEYEHQQNRRSYFIIVKR